MTNPVQDGDDYRVDVLIQVDGTGQFQLWGTSLRLGVGPATGLVVDQTRTIQSSNLPQDITFQFFQNASGTQIIANGVSANYWVPLSGSFLAFSIFFQGTPGECYSVGFLSAPQYIQIGNNPTNLTTCDPTNVGNPVQVCYPDLFIKGTIAKTLGMTPCTGSVNQGVSEVDVVVDEISTSGIDYSTVTATDGSWMQVIGSGLYGGDFRISPSKDNYDACGITVQDLDLIRAYILLYWSCWTYPWQIVAADVNMDGAITNGDLYILNQLLAGLQPTMQSWTFVPTNTYATWSAPYCGGVPSYNPYRDVYNVTTSVAGQDFVAIKVGDVDGTCTECNNNGMLTDPEPEAIVREKINQLELSYEFVESPAGQTELVLRSVRDIEVGVLALALDCKNFRIQNDFELPAWNLNEDWFAAIEPQGGSAKLIFHSKREYKNPFKEEQEVLRVPVELTSGAPTLGLDGGVEGFNLHALDGQIAQVTILRREDNFSDQVMMWPNPAKEYITISQAFDGMMIVDPLGRTMWRYQGAEEVMNLEVSLAGWHPGMYFLLKNGRKAASFALQP